MQYYCLATSLTGANRFKWYIPFLYFFTNEDGFKTLYLFLFTVDCIIFTKYFKIPFGGDPIVDTTALMGWFFCGISALKIPYNLQSFSYFETFWCFTQIFLSPQVKWNAISSNKHGIYELPHELPDNLRLRILWSSYDLILVRTIGMEYMTQWNTNLFWCSKLQFQSMRPLNNDIEYWLTLTDVHKLI